ncbi:hypothetical protein [Kibdelosporangium phytohabitans]|uniref:hypothetical protein n=1 Tax=Kibdelosporangium phytohabitans TaxID=860235 RepID=UPI0012FA4892|nr:hypothetical protein [Kibdelosporangium phytohabitans]MBE1461155.1 hypothetical protein [Kibdelosporangium phytohabitans]
MSAQRWTQLPRAEQDTLTTVLSRWEARMRALEPLYAKRADPAVVQRVSWTLRGVRHMDHMFRGVERAVHRHGPARGQLGAGPVHGRLAAVVSIPSVTQDATIPF